MTIERNYELCQLFLDLQVLFLREITNSLAKNNFRHSTRFKILQSSILQIDEIIRQLRSRDLHVHEVSFYQDLYNEVLDKYNSD